MQWSCPHCGIMLAVAGDVLGTGWSFSRCYKCGGYALVRRAEINVIKVDKAPPGEKVILPEASADPAIGLLSAKVTEKVSKYTQINPSAQANTSSVSVSKKEAATRLTQEPSLSPQAPPLSFQNKNNQYSTFDIRGASLPDPLPADPHPDSPTKRRKSLVLPVGISFATVLMTISGSYLYIQGESLWTQLHDKSAPRLTQNEESITVTAPPPTILKTEISQMIAKPPAVAEAPSMAQIVDQVHKSAMAPEKPAVLPSEKKLEPVAKNSHSNIIIKIRVNRANLHSGPGNTYPVIGTAPQEGFYQVMDWNNRWFKIQKLNPKSGEVITQATEKTIGGWIRNDLIQVINKAGI